VSISPDPPDLPCTASPTRPRCLCAQGTPHQLPPVGPSVRRWNTRAPSWPWRSAPTERPFSQAVIKNDPSIGPEDGPTHRHPSGATTRRTTLGVAADLAPIVAEHSGKAVRL
jgi:hypothetical protein